MENNNFWDSTIIGLLIKYLRSKLNIAGSVRSETRQYDIKKKVNNIMLLLQVVDLKHKII